MAGGFGGGSWGGGAFGGFAVGGLNQVVEADPLTITESLSVLLPVRVLTAQALSAFLVRVDFSQDLDYASGPILNPLNYGLSPFLSVFDVAPGPDSKSVILQTLEQQAVNYIVTVSAAQALSGDLLNPANNSAVFPGFPVVPTFFAAAQSDTKVQLVFSTEMLQNAAFSDPASYLVTDMSGTPLSVTSATPSGPTPITRVTLEIGGAGLTGGGYYAAVLDSVDIQATSGFLFLSRSDLFQWQKMLTSPISIRFPSFTGEVTSGLLGQPAGQVFFSPALDVAAADSSIQIDEVALCTRAYDVYEVPGIPDPQPFMLFGGFGPGTLNNTDDVMFATAARLGLAQINLGGGGGWQEAETMPTAVDGPADAELAQPVDAFRSGFLNDLRSLTFPSATHSQLSTLFDGTTEFVSIGDVAALQFTAASSFSLSCWVKTTAASGVLLGKRNIGTDTGYQLSFEAGKLQINLVNSLPTNRIQLETVDTYNSGGWHFVVATYDGSSTAVGTRLYVDGHLVATVANADGLTLNITNTDSFKIGAIDPGPSLSYGPGNIDDVAIYGKQLSSAEVLAMFGDGSSLDLTLQGPVANLIGYWRMGDGASFPVIPDDSINSNDGTMTSMEIGDLEAVVPTRSLNSLSFGGTDEFVTMGDPAALKFTDASAFSLGFWLRSTEAGSPRLVSKREFGGNNRGYEVRLDSGAIGFQRINTAPANNAAITTTTATFNDGLWHHVVATTDGTDAAGMAIYVDGVPQAVGVDWDGLAGTIDITADFQVSGHDGTNFPLTGMVDDVGVWSVALTAAQVVAVYSGGVPRDLAAVGPTADLVGYWKMGEGASFPTIPDDSANSNDGTATNMESVDLADGVTAGVFRTADNLSSLAGPTVSINLQP